LIAAAPKYESNREDMIKVNSKCHSVVRISISFPGALEISLKFNSIFISAITALSRAAFVTSGGQIKVIS
jgi:hypothetical protein